MKKRTKLLLFICYLGVAKQLYSQATDDLTRNTYSASTSSRSNLLHSAIRQRNRSALERLLSRPVDLEERDERGRTPLHMAVGCKAHYLLKMLLEAGTDVRAKDNEGFEPIHYATLFGTPETVIMLRDYGADLAAKDAEGMLPLELAANRGNVSSVRALLEVGVNVDECREDGISSLHVAAVLGQTGVLKLLIEKGASLDVESDMKTKCTPLHAALLYNQEESAEILIQAGANPLVHRCIAFEVVMQNSLKRSLKTMLAYAVIRLNSISIARYKKSLNKLLENSITLKRCGFDDNVITHYFVLKHVDDWQQDAIRVLLYKLEKTIPFCTLLKTVLIHTKEKAVDFFLNRMNEILSNQQPQTWLMTRVYGYFWANTPLSELCDKIQCLRSVHSASDALEILDTQRVDEHFRQIFSDYVTTKFSSLPNFSTC